MGLPIWAEEAMRREQITTAKDQRHRAMETYLKNKVASFSDSNTVNLLGVAVAQDDGGAHCLMRFSLNNVTKTVEFFLSSSCLEDLMGEEQGPKVEACKTLTEAVAKGISQVIASEMYSTLKINLENVLNEDV